MRTVFTQTAGVLGLLLAASTGWAQQGVKPAEPGGPKAPIKRAGAEEGGGIHRLVIYNGPARTVHYVTDGSLSSSEDTSLRDLERAENDVGLVDQLLALKLQYIRDERQLQARRTEVQRLLYGYSSETTAGLAGATSGFPGSFGYGGFGGYGVTGGFFYPGYGISGPGAAGYPFGVGSGGFVNSGSNSLAYGVGDEGRIKTEIAHVLAGQSTPEYTAMATRNLMGAMARAGQSETLRNSKVVPVVTDAEAKGYFQRGYEVPPEPRKDGKPEGKPESRRDHQPDEQVTVTVRLGDRTEQVKGTLLGEESGWLHVRTGAGEEVIRTSEIVRLVRAPK
jgi:hypothetical protein